jgi:Gram-negative bacterial TonB protein C-terminal
MNSMKIGTFAFVSALACALTCEAADPQEYYPGPALRACLAGQATVRCTVEVDESLRDCSIVSEMPPGVGFAEGTLAVTHLWRVRPRAVDGIPAAGGIFQRTVVWLPPTDCGATWLNHMTQDAYYPANALRANVRGRTTVQCDAGVDGRLSGCKVLNETPLGYGFGEAALRMYQTGLQMTVTPEIARGGAVITRTTGWTPPPSPTPAPAAPAR